MPVSLQGIGYRKQICHQAHEEAEEATAAKLPNTSPEHLSNNSPLKLPLLPVPFRLPVFGF